MTSVTPWRPLSSRAKPFETFHEGVSPALQEVLRDWIYLAADSRPAVVDRVILRTHLRYVDRQDGSEDKDPSTSRWQAAVEARRAFLAYDSPAGRLLDIVDALLDLSPVQRALPPPTTLKAAIFLSALLMTADHRPTLQRHLDDARSIYTISGDCRRLERRVDETSTKSLDNAAASASANLHAGSSQEHLRRAWALLQQRQPDAPGAYREAIKAVEASAHAVVQPANTKATLGTMIGQLRDHPQRFSLGGPRSQQSQDISILAGMVTFLWSGQTSRHGAQTPTKEETLAEATAAVQLATALVQWFASGFVQRIT